ncbi:hypothetical protein EVAR_5641_1 [Eumeta japonica]|uniref:Uncharacterized protein n=1 Tax=Eumeta variegata TaxID=151549 RepID=A0A4C1T825_EUMVA|nr:hypothetical protein EVAR_5641_1 [Eumeta japonica]
MMLNNDEGDRFAKAPTKAPAEARRDTRRRPRPRAPRDFTTLSTLTTAPPGVTAPAISARRSSRSRSECAAYEHDTPRTRSPFGDWRAARRARWERARGGRRGAAAARDQSRRRSRDARAGRTHACLQIIIIAAATPLRARRAGYAAPRYGRRAPHAAPRPHSCRLHLAGFESNAFRSASICLRVSGGTSIARHRSFR